MIGSLNLIKSHTTNLVKKTLFPSLIDNRGILSQINKISNSPSGISLFRGNQKITIQHDKRPENNTVNKHGSFFTGLPPSTTIVNETCNFIKNKNEKNMNNKEIENADTARLNTPTYQEDLSGCLLDEYLLDNNKLFHFSVKESNTLQKKENGEHTPADERLKKVNIGFTPEYYKITVE